MYYDHIAEIHFASTISTLSVSITMLFYDIIYELYKSYQTEVSPVLEKSPEKSPRSLNSKRKPRRRNITGGAFIRIDPL